MSANASYQPDLHCAGPVEPVSCLQIFSSASTAQLSAVSSGTRADAAAKTQRTAGAVTAFTLEGKVMANGRGKLVEVWLINYSS